MFVNAGMNSGTTQPIGVERGFRLPVIFEISSDRPATSDFTFPSSAHGAALLLGHPFESLGGNAVGL